MRSACFLSSLILCAAACSASPAAESSPAPTPAASEDPPASDDPGEDKTADKSDAAPPLTGVAKNVDDLFTAAVKTNSFSGSVVLVEGDKTLLAKGYGMADRVKQIPNAADTVFRIGSVTKQFTASAILALADEGKLKTTDLVSKYFPEYPTENLVKDGVELTLHHLLSQTSGLPDGLKTKYFKDNVFRHEIDNAKMIAAIKTSPLVRKPGTQFEYLNYNYFLLGLVVERVSGKAWDAYLQERFFTPLGMKDTGVVATADAKARMAIGYQEKTGTLTTNGDPKYSDYDLTWAFGAGSVYSTVTDIARWSIAIDSGAALPAASSALLFTPNLSEYGYGWILQERNSVAFEWHNGALSPLGWSSYVLRVPSKSHRFVAYLSNMEIDLIEPFELKVEALAIK